MQADDNGDTHVQPTTVMHSTRVRSQDLPLNRSQVQTHSDAGVYAVITAISRQDQGLVLEC